MYPKSISYYGAETFVPDGIQCNAGPLSMVFEPDKGFLRYIRLNDQEILRGIYSAVRDHNWETIAPVVSNLTTETTDDTFNLTFDVTCQANEIDFFWKGTITGDSQGTVQFTMDGVAHSTFQRNRIGFCVLHPLGCGGHSCVVAKVDGTVEQGAFPQYISPHQPFMDMRSISHEVVPGLSAKVEFEGDIFEMEDQRNWTDASFKTYCTPLSVPYPVEVQKGTQIVQSITITLEGDVPATAQGRVSSTPVIDFTVSEAPAVNVPKIGVGSASHGEVLNATEVRQLKVLNLSHLRLDLELSDPTMEARLRQGCLEANALRASLELALFLSDAADDELNAFSDLVKKVGPPIARYLIFHTSEMSTSARWVELARRYIPNAQLGAGTNAYFTELNRERPPVEAVDFVCYSINPQVHAFDNASLVETLETQGQTVKSTRQFVGGLPIAVTPITLRPRFNPNATGPEPEPEAGQVPSQVDLRQMALLGAGWTLGSLKYLSESGADSLTYYETTGWRGVMETEYGSLLPRQFQLIRDDVFPLYHVLADVGEFAGGSVIPSRSSTPLSVDGMVLRKDGTTRVLLANLSSKPQRIRLHCSKLGTQVRVKQLNETNFEDAVGSPESFRSNKGELMEIKDGALELELLPFAIVRIDGGKQV